MDTAHEFIEEDASQDSALKQWWQKLNARLQQLYPHTHPDTIARTLLSNIQLQLNGNPETKALGLADQITADEVKAWVIGRDVPREHALHEALMDSIGLSVKLNGKALSDKEILGLSEKQTQQLSGPSRKIAEYRKDMIAAHGAAYAEMERQPRVTVHCNGISRQGNSDGKFPSAFGHGSEHGAQHDEPFMPPRIINELVGCDDANYYALKEQELRHIMAKTENSAEFLRCWRLTHESQHGNALSLNEVSDLSGLNTAVLHRIETGSDLPSQKFITSITKAFNGDKASYEHYVGLVIGNRLTAADWYRTPEHFDPRVAVMKMQAMPRIYWEEALQQTADLFYKRDGSERDKPVWAEQVRPLTNQGEYFRAIRFVFDLNLQDVDRVISPEHKHKARLKHLEKIEDDVNYERSDALYEKVQTMRTALADYYEGYQKDHHRTAWFDRKVCDDLPHGTASAIRHVQRKHLKEGKQEGQDGTERGAA